MGAHDQADRDAGDHAQQVGIRAKACYHVEKSTDPSPHLEPKAFAKVGDLGVTLLEEIPFD